MNEAALNPQNWEAFLKLELRAAEDKTRLVPIKRYGPLSVQRPFYPEKDCCHVYLLHPPGGVVGGDKLELQLDIKNKARALFTTPGATKFYLSATDTARVNQQFNVGAAAQLEYLPMENIYFPGALVRSKTSLTVQPDSKFILWEKHCLGRPANREFFAKGELVSEIVLHQEQQLIFTEKQRINADEINRASGLRGNPVMGSLLAYGDKLDASTIKSLRDITPQDGISGITQLLPELLIARYMGKSTQDINAYFIRLWQILRPALMQRDACHPRIWNT